jgi:hypothetical protein
MRKRAATLILTLLMVLAHILLVSAPVISSGGSGEGQGWAVMLFDLPLVLLVSIVPGGQGILNGYHQTAYVIIFGVGGALMYAGIGALIGRFIDHLRAKANAA